MVPAVNIGVCDACGHTFAYELIHNGFNDSAYAYCDECGMTALIDDFGGRTPEGMPPYRAITALGEASLAPCPCGGSFRADAAPRCPGCRAVLSPEAAAVWIEASAPGTARGWRWQRDWRGLYAIIVEGRVVSNPWRDDS